MERPIGNYVEDPGQMERRLRQDAFYMASNVRGEKDTIDAVIAAAKQIASYLKGDLEIIEELPF